MGYTSLHIGCAGQSPVFVCYPPALYIFLLVICWFIPICLQLVPIFVGWTPFFLVPSSLLGRRSQPGHVSIPTTWYTWLIHVDIVGKHLVDPCLIPYPYYSSICEHVNDIPSTYGLVSLKPGVVAHFFVELSSPLATIFMYIYTYVYTYVHIYIYVCVHTEAS